MDKLGLYIHIPFCERKCYYCDFISFPENNNIDIYIINLIKELAQYKEDLTKYSIDTVFIGGGTPSSIDAKYIKRIMDFIYENFNTSDIKEITLEVNPGTVDRIKTKIYKDIGINRISMGLQSLDDRLLKSIGRIHTSKEFFESFHMFREFGFHNINVDLMFGLPSQTIEDLNRTLCKVVELGIEHISLYGLIIEENTLMNKWHNKGILHLPDEDLERRMYHESLEFLEGKGYKQYEISNFSRRGFECRHNLIYWKIRPYLGVGLGSHSNLFNKRFWNTTSLIKYNQCLSNNLSPIDGEEIIEEKTKIAEFCIMGLRLNSGIDTIEFKDRFGLEIEEIYKDVIEKHVRNGLLDHRKERIVLSSKGLDLANLVEVDFMP